MAAAAEDMTRLLTPDAEGEQDSEKPEPSSDPGQATEQPDSSDQAACTSDTCKSDALSPPPEGCDNARIRAGHHDWSPNKTVQGQIDPKHTAGPSKEGVQSQEERVLSWQTNDSSLAPTIASRLYHWYRTKPKRRAFVFVADRAVAKGKSTRKNMVQQSITRREVYTMAVRCAHYLITTQSLRPGEVVVNTLPSSLERLLLDLAVVLAGAVPLDALRCADSEDVLNFCRGLRPLNVSLVLCARTDPLSTAYIRHASEADAGLCFIYFQGDCTDGSHLLGMLSNDSATSLADAERVLHDVLSKDRAIIWISRGRTENGPKVVAHDHFSVLSMGRNFQDHALQLHKKDVYFCGAHCGGMYGFPTMYLLTGVTTVFEDQTPYPSRWDLGPNESDLLRPLLSFTTLSRQSCTKAFFPVRLLNRYLDARAIPAHNGRKLKRLVVSGDHVKTVLVRKLLKHVAREISVTYCMTEVGMVAYSQPTKPFSQSDLLTVVSSVLLQTRSVPDEDVLTNCLSGTLDVRPDRPVVQVVEEPLLDNSGETTFAFREVDLVRTDDLGVVSRGKLKLVGHIDRSLLLPEKPLFIRERFEFMLRELQHVEDAVLLVYDSDGADVSGKSLVACLTIDVQDDDAYPEMLANRARYECERQAETLRYWKPDEYWVFGVFPKTVTGAVDRQRICAMVDRARRQRLPFDWHYRQCQVALDRVTELKPRRCACCCIL